MASYLLCTVLNGLVGRFLAVDVATFSVCSIVGVSTGGSVGVVFNG